MNADNICHLQGTVQGENWSRYNRRQRGQVRFWLGVTRELAGDGLDRLLCAIEPRTAEELQHYQTQLRPGRSVQLSAAARSCPEACEQHPGVVFVAESCGFDGVAAAAVHQATRHHGVRGKMAAAGDVEQPQLLEVRP